MINIPNKLSKDVSKKFKLVNNTLSRDVKDNPKDRIQIEIGDSKQPDFKPQVKISRWDNEVNFSIRAQEHPDAIVETEGKTIKYITPEYEVHQYELDPGDIGEDGGLEFEWILPSKPASNVLTATIQTKELDFFYQPPLTQQEIDEGVVRPENVVGSYAVYHKTRGGMNLDGGTEYKTGKAFHIFRPKVVDSNGSEVWADITINESDGLLTLNIDKNFLDNAVYPVTVDPTFGYTSIGASSSGTNNNYAYSAKGTPSANGEITKISMYAQKNAADGTFKAVTWLESTGAVVSNGVGNTVLVNNTSFQWWDMTYTTSPSVSSGVEYEVGAVMSATSTNWKFDTVSSGVGGGYDLGNNYASPASLTLDITTRQYSSYATYKQILVSDDFNRADSGTLGANWTDDNAGFGISSNKAVNTATADQAYWSGTFNPASADYDVRVTLHQTGTVSEFGFFGRRTASDTMYIVTINTFDQKLRLYKRVSGSDTELASYTGGYSTGNTYTFTLNMVGTALKVYEGSTQRISTTDSDISGIGKAGLLAWNDNGSLDWDDFYVLGEPAAAGSTSPSVSPSVSPSRSASISPSVSPSISVSISPSTSSSVSPSVSPSASPSSSISPSISPSRSSSVSPSVSPSASPSASVSPSISPSASSSVSPSVSPSASPSSSISPSISPSVSPSVSSSISPSASPSSSISPSVSPSVSSSVSPSVSPSVGSSFSPSVSISTSPSTSPSTSSSASPSASPSSSISPSISPSTSTSISPSVSSSTSPSASISTSPSVSPSVSSSESPSSSISPSVSSSSSPSASPSSSISPSVSPSISTSASPSISVSISSSVSPSASPSTSISPSTSPSTSASASPSISPSPSPAPYVSNKQKYLEVGGGLIIPIGPARISVWSTFNRPSDPMTGEWGFNSTLGYREIYDGTDWVRLDPQS